MANGKPCPGLSRLRLQLNEVSLLNRQSVLFQSPQTIRDALGAFHAAVIVAAHLRASLVHTTDIVRRAAWSLGLLERVAAFRNREVVLGAASLFDVIDLQPMKLHPMNLIAGF